MLALLLQVWV